MVGESLFLFLTAEGRRNSDQLRFCMQKLNLMFPLLALLTRYSLVAMPTKCYRKLIFNDVITKPLSLEQVEDCC